MEQIEVRPQPGPQAISISRERRKLLGLDKPTKIAPTDPVGDKPYEPLTDTERASRLAALLEKAQARKERQEALEANESSPLGVSSPE